MTLAIIPLSVMLMSAATNTYAKAATGVANGKSNEKDNSKKMSDKDLLAAANQIQNYLYGYYNESLGFVKGDYIKQLAQASLYDGDIQRQFANEINEATKQTLADKAKDDSVVASNNKAQSDASKEVDYLNYMAKSLDTASDILSKNSGAKVEFDILKKSIASDLDNLNDALENVKNTDKHDKAKFQKAVTNLRNEIKTTEDHISKFGGNGYELTALSRLSHALDNQYNNAENTLNDLINQENGRTEDINELINSDKMQEALDKALDDTKAKFEKSDAAKMSKVDKLLNDLIKRENQRTSDVKALIESDKMKETLEDAFNKQVSDTKNNLEKSDAEKMDKVNKELDVLINHEKQRTSDINDLIASDKMQEELEKAAQKKLDQQVGDKKAKFEKEDAAKMAKVNKQLDDLLNHEKQRTSDFHNLIDSDKMQEQLEKAAKKAFNKQVADTKAKFEKEDAAKMGKVNKELDALLNHEKQRSADVKELINSDKLHDALEDAAKKAFAEKVAAKEAELEKDDNAKMADFNNKVDNLVKEQSSKLASIYAAMHKVENKNDKKSDDAYNKLAKTLKSFVAQQLKNVNELNKRVVKDASNKNKETLANFEKALKEAVKKANKKHSVKKLQAQPVAALSFRMADEENSDDEYQFKDSSDIPNEYRDDYVNHLSDLLGKSKVLDQESSLLTKKMDEINALKAKLSKIANLSDKEFTNSSELNDDLNALYELVNQTNNSDAADMGSMQTLATINSLVDDLKNDYAVALADYMVKPSDDSKNNDDKKSSDDQKANDDKKSSDDQKANDDKKSSDDQKNNDDNTASSTKIDGDKGNDSALTPDVKPDQPAVNPSNKNNAGQPKKPGKKPAKKAPKEKKVSIKKSKKSLAKLNKKLKHKKMTKRAKKALLKKIHALKNKIKRAIVKRDKKKLAKITKKLHSKKISKKTRKRLHKQAAALRKEIKKNHVKPAKKKVAKKVVKKHTKKSTKKSKKKTKKSKKSKKSSKRSKKAAKEAKKHQKKLTKRAAKRVNTYKKAIAKITKKLKSKHLTKKHRHSLIAKRVQLRKAVRKLTK